MLAKMWKKWKSCWWECKMVRPLWKTEWMALKNLKIKLPHDPTIPFWEYTSKRIQSKILKRYIHTHVYLSVLHNSQEVEVAQIDKRSINRWTDKETVVYAYNGMGGGGGHSKLAFTGYRVSVLQNEKVVEIYCTII